ncbi:MAG: Fic family protein [Betaproteobacteria bacterium]|nr:Fic family protein [Betaproteobacteria bacterium]
MFKPNFHISPQLAGILMEIEASRQALAAIDAPAVVLAQLRAAALVDSTHYSTRIEGNLLTRQQVQEVLQGGKVSSQRPRDLQEVRNYRRALAHVEKLADQDGSGVRETELKTLHALVMNGRQRPAPYRDGQNVIRDSASNAIVYMPPQANDVAVLMHDMVAWINRAIKEGKLPLPLVAGIAHYQYATIHPYYDGNGRTARLLARLLLHRHGWRLQDLYCLEEYYVRNLADYYRNLAVGESHNYYMGRAEADISAWLEYFCRGMASSLASARSRLVADCKAGDGLWQLRRRLDQRALQVLELFAEHQHVTTRQIADLFAIGPRAALNQCNKWIKEGFLIRHGEATKTRRYTLARRWQKLLPGAR